MLWLVCRTVLFFWKRYLTAILFRCLRIWSGCSKICGRCALWSVFMLCDGYVDTKTIQDLARLITETRQCRSNIHQNWTGFDPPQTCNYHQQAVGVYCRVQGYANVGIHSLSVWKVTHWRVSILMRSRPAQLITVGRSAAQWVQVVHFNPSYCRFD
jgi:hypothetical protein